MCSRKQADGLLSGAAWGRVELPNGSVVAHAAVRRGSVLVCPTCRDAYGDWEARALSAVGAGGGTSLNAAS